ncbi:MAG: hypothetical protein RJA59_2078, partial [Pseudomonadota bacterium]
GFAYVVVQHLSPDHRSLMVEILSKHTSMPVRRIEDDMAVERDTVYLIPPGKNVALRGSVLKLSERPPGHVVPLPVDFFFSSLAESQGEAATAVVLSGTGSDGTRGVQDVKDAGGTILVQDESSAKFDGMPRAATATGLADAVLPPEQIAERLVQLGRRGAAPVVDARGGEFAETYPRILESLRSVTGVDFTNYKLATILRRIERRMGITGAGSIGEYAAILAGSAAEAVALQGDLLIGVTRFFRDTDAFASLRSRVVDELVRKARWDQQLRVWVAGCSTGEEAYGLGILFLEAMEAAGRRTPLKIFATDVDREALDAASTGSYPESIAVDVSPGRLHRFFSRRGERYLVGRELRSLVLFAHHNLLKDPPFTRVDLVTCRNLLIYLEPVLQRKAISIFHYALNQGGHLLLGPSEALGDAADRFRVLDAKWKLYQAHGTSRLPLADPIPFTADPRRTGQSPRAAEVEAGLAEDAFRWIVNEFAPTGLLVTPEGVLVHAFGNPDRFLTVPSGRASLVLADLLPRPLSAAVSTAVHQAHHQHREVRYLGVQPDAAGAPRGVDVRAVPLLLGKAEQAHVLVLLEEKDAPPPPGAESLSDATHSQIGDLQGELQYMKENLQATIEELETANEELQSTNEELLSSNEELQSTNEELQSVNEELHTVNQEYQSKIQELSDLNADMENLLRGSDVGTLFLDEGLAIRRYTPAVTTLVNLIPRDVGRSIEDLACNFPAAPFVAVLREVIETGRPRDWETATTDGRWLQVRVLPFVGGSLQQRGVAVTFVDVSGAMREKTRLQAVLDGLPNHVAVLDPGGRIVLVNASWTRFAAANGAGEAGASTGVGSDYLAVALAASGPDAETAHAAAIGLRRVLDGGVDRFELVYPCPGPQGERWYLLHAAPLPWAFGGAVVSHVDVTAAKRAERELERSRGE